ncbi:MAG TPA: hypothetical protein ENN44_02105 [Methanoculleus sp.]|nr:hypothetical protein [Methanoculleus sp.]
MEKAGFLAVNRYNAVDANGDECTILTCTLCGTRFGVRVGEVSQACGGLLSARVEPLRNRQGQVLLGSAGTMTLSRSGKALNIELVNGDRFTVSLSAVRELLAQRRSYCRIVRIPRKERLLPHPLSPSPRLQGQDALLC